MSERDNPDFFSFKKKSKKKRIYKKAEIFELNKLKSIRCSSKIHAYCQYVLAI